MSDSIVGRQASIIRLHTPAHHSGVNGLGSLGTTVTENHKTTGGLTLTILEGGHILVKSETKKTEMVLYAANIIDVVLK